MIITDLSVSIETKKIISNFSLSLTPGTVHALMGPNGSGKSSLANALSGHPAYEVTGTVTVDGQNILELSATDRARAGIFVAFQGVPEIPGVSVSTFLKESYSALKGPIDDFPAFIETLKTCLSLVQLDEAFLDRALNEGFSGGEKKRFELLQLLVVQPRIIILDEIDSGLDVDALRLVAQTIEQLKNNNPKTIVLMITHYPHMLERIMPDQVHCMVKGAIVRSGGNEIALQIEQTGYEV